MAVELNGFAGDNGEIEKEFDFPIGENYPEPYDIHWLQKYAKMSTGEYIYGILQPKYLQKREIWFIVWDLLVSEGLAGKLTELDPHIMQKIHNVLLEKENYDTELWLEQINKLNAKNKW